jgi:hypothetical protein
LATPLLSLVVSVVWLTLSYDGKCGGFLPSLAGAKPCTLAEYVVGNASLLALIVWTEYWPFIIALLVLAVGIGYALDRRSEHNAA